jgi:predicted metal-binding protein
MDPTKPILSICVTCRDGREGASDTRGGSRLARRVAEKLEQSNNQQMQLRGVQCMSQCKRSCIVSLAAEGRFTYVFGELDPDDDTHVDALFALVAQYSEAPEGFLERKDRPSPLQASILGFVFEHEVHTAIDEDMRVPSCRTTKQCDQSAEQWTTDRVGYMSFPPTRYLPSSHW